MGAVSMVRVPTALPALGDLPPYPAEGTGESEPELVSLSRALQEPNSMENKPLLEHDNILCRDFQWE